jgi:hypothetical protein
MDYQDHDHASVTLVQVLGKMLLVQGSGIDKYLETYLLWPITRDSTTKTGSSWHVYAVHISKSPWTPDTTFQHQTLMLDTREIY